ncbi:MAG: DUF4838 domain-containing protein [Limnochordia bacterium]
MLKLYTLGDDPVVAFAAEELARYLERIGGGPLTVSNRASYDSEAGGIWLGVWDSFGTAFPAPKSDHELDDAIFLRSVGTDQLLLSGANPRSVLFAVYAYLESLGCRWVRMGEDGEILPRGVSARLDGYDITEYANYRYRGVCIEGGVSIEHAKAMVNYMAKKRFNTYFIQFQNAYMFWSRWYDRKSDKPQLEIERAEAYTGQLIEEIKRRGLALQMVGHGWTCECLDVPGLGWIPVEEELPPEKRELLALVNGKREWWRGVPINTELCMSNPRAFKMLVEYIVKYAKEHPDVDILHIWMSDGSNNRCECDGCRQKIPSDWYVDLLNALDAELEKEGLPTKLVFLIYVDLLWAPEESKLNNPDRFILMFAPISRNYRQSLLEGTMGPATEEPRPFELNRNAFPRSTAVNVHYLKAWQRIFSGDGFTFDYHLLWKPSIIEPTGLFIAEILYRDIVGTERLGLQGIVNCQVQRYFFPTGLAMEVSGRTMWDKDKPLEEIRREFFAAAFGEAGARVQEKMEKLSALMDSDLPFKMGPTPDEAYQADLKQAEDVLSDLKSLTRRYLADDRDPLAGEKASWFYLSHGVAFMEIILKGLQGLAAGCYQELAAAYRAAAEYVMEHEDELHEVCDSVQWKTWLTRYAEDAEKRAEAQS